MVFTRVFSIVCFLREEGLICSQLLPVCCWRYHVMSILGSPSYFEPEPVASVFAVFIIFLHMVVLVLASSQCRE